jgi:hypothetical protein
VPGVVGVLESLILSSRSANGESELSGFSATVRIQVEAGTAPKQDD